MYRFITKYDTELETVSINQIKAKSIAIAIII